MLGEEHPLHKGNAVPGVAPASPSSSVGSSPDPQRASRDAMSAALFGRPHVPPSGPTWRAGATKRRPLFPYEVRSGFHALSMGEGNAWRNVRDCHVWT